MSALLVETAKVLVMWLRNGKSENEASLLLVQYLVKWTVYKGNAPC